MDTDAPFPEYINTPEPRLELDRAALLIAQSEYPGLDIDAYLRRLDKIAAAAQVYLHSAHSVQDKLLALNQTLFEDLGFAGNVQDYYDPRNSFLNEVMDRKLGIPITLAVLYMEVGRRLDIHLEGVAFPGHFLVKLPLEQGDVVLDPFFGGVSLTETDLVSRILQLFGERRPAYLDLRRWLAGAGKREILARMLRNLKQIYLHNKNFDRALAVSNQIVATAPDSAEDVRDRGIILEYLECPQAALRDYRRYLELAPSAQDYAVIRSRIQDLQSHAPLIN